MFDLLYINCWFYFQLGSPWRVPYKSTFGHVYANLMCQHCKHFHFLWSFLVQWICCNWKIVLEILLLIKLVCLADMNCIITWSHSERSVALNSQWYDNLISFIVSIRIFVNITQVFCTKKKPNCDACPLRTECRHFASAFARFASDYCL